MRFPRLAALVMMAGSAQAAAFQQIDLSPYVNEGFTNSWFINGADFAPLIGSTYGNWGSTVPFWVANPSDGAGGNNNFWFGLYSGPGTLFGPPGSVTIPVWGRNVTKVYTLADNTFGQFGVTEFTMQLNGAPGFGDIVFGYVGAWNTQDYNVNCGTTGCATTPAASYFYIDMNSWGQWLQKQSWSVPVGYQFDSITFSQVDGTDGAILAGVTLETPEPLTLTLFGAGLLGAAALRRKRKNAD